MTVGSARRPAAFRRGARRKATSVAPMVPTTLATSRSATTPGRPVGSESRRNPARVRRRLSPSRGATSAMVPIATRSIQGLQIELRPDLGAHRRAHREREPGAAEPLVGEAALRPVRVQEGEGRQRLGGDEVVVDDDHVHAALLRFGDAGVIARAAIAGDDQRRPRVEAARESLVAEPVSALKPIRHEAGDVTPERFEDVAGDGGAGGPVDVVVAEDRDALFALDGAAQALGRRATVRHLVGSGEAGEAGREEVLGEGLLPEPAAQQDLPERGSHPDRAPSSRAASGSCGRTPMSLARPPSCGAFGTRLTRTGSTRFASALAAAEELLVHPLGRGAAT